MKIISWTFVGSMGACLGMVLVDGLLLISPPQDNVIPVGIVSLMAGLLGVSTGTILSIRFSKEERRGHIPE